MRWCCFGLIFYPPSRCISLSSIFSCWNCFHVVDFQLVTLGESTRVSGISPQTASMAFSYTHTHTHRTRHIIRLSLRSSQSIPPHLFASLPYLSLFFFPPSMRETGQPKREIKQMTRGAEEIFHHIKSTQYARPVIHGRCFPWRAPGHRVACTPSTVRLRLRYKK